MVFQTDGLPYDLRLLPEEAIAKIADLIDEGTINPEPENDTYYDTINSYNRDVMECPNCGRLHVETAPRTGKFKSFIREFPDPVE
jgi:hypothetical protein